MQDCTSSPTLFDTTFDPNDARLPERFRSKFEVRDCGYVTPCWVWTACLTEKGYGTWKFKRRQTCAHIFAYEFLIGAVPNGKQLDHICRNRSCVNASHLEPVTCQVNVLRGDGITSRNAKKTHCIRGHEFDLFNTKIRKDGRECRLCTRANQQLRRQRRRKVKPMVK